MMIRAHRLALRPSRAARRGLDRCEWARRLAWNAALAWHRSERAADRPVPDEYPTAAWLRIWRKASETVAKHPDLALVPARVFEYVAEDLDRAWRAVQRQHAKPPRFARFDAQGGGFGVDGVVKVSATHIQIPRTGALRLMPNRRPSAKSGQIPAGTYTRARLVREHGEWFATLSLEHAEAAPIEGPATVGLDWGVRKLATLSDGTIYANPRALERVAVRAEKARQAVARKLKARDLRLGPPKKGEHRKQSTRLQRARRAVAKQCRRAADIRKDGIHHATKEIAARDEHVACENLRPKNLTRKRVGKGRAAKASLNRRILDACPGMFLSILDYKLTARGRRLDRVNPAYTSQDCSACGARNNCGSNPIYTCASCGSVMDRDVNAANNILARALTPLPDVSAGSVGTKTRGKRSKTSGAGKPVRGARAMIRERRGRRDEVE